MKRNTLLGWSLTGLLTNALAGCSVFEYYHSKLTLFDDDKRTENFRNMDQIFPAQTIKASQTPLALDVKPVDLPSSYQFNGHSKRLDHFLKQSETTGILVLKDNAIVHEEYFAGYSADDKATSFSVAKSYIATLVGIALQEGRIRSLRDPVTDYVPDLKESGFNGVAIEDILQMSSAIDFSEDYNDKSTDAFTIYDALFVWLRPISEAINDYGSRGAAGEEFHYASINTQALGMLVEKVYGQPIHQVMEEKLWSPLGATKSAYWLTDMHDEAITFWGLNATLRDYARLGLLYMNQGKVNDRQVLSEDWIKRATFPDRAYLLPGKIAEDWGYQYHWWVPRGSRGDFSAIGIYGQFIYVNPQAGVVIVKTSADKEFKANEFEAIQAFRAIAEKLKDAQFENEGHAGL